MKYDGDTVKQWAGDSQWRACRAEFARFKDHGYTAWGSEGFWALAIYSLQRALGAGADGGGATIGDHVFIGCNTSVIGRLKIGDGAVVAANSLVISDVPAGLTAIGVPAKNLPDISGRGARVGAPPVNPNIAA